MNSLLKFALALFGLGMLAAGAGFAFAPLRVGADFAVGITSLAGLGTLRANMGGLFITLGLFTLYGLRAGKAHWLGVPLLMLGLIALLRLGHLASDGFSEAGLRSTFVELVGIALLWLGQRRATSTPPRA